MGFWRVRAGWAMVCGCLAFGMPAVQAQPSLAPDSRPVVSAPRLGSAPSEDAELPLVRLNEQIIHIPVAGDASLQTTIYKPDGPGPFPLIVFNHGKIKGDPRTQARSEPLPLAREFVRRGYVVVAPNRRGFAQSGGTYGKYGCDVERNGEAQAEDVAATVAFMSTQPYVDAQHMVVAGVSHGGLATIAYGAQAAPGVRGLINFSGGLRQDACSDWQGNLTQAFGAYGEKKAKVPSLWLYGQNDSVFPPGLGVRMYDRYVAGGAAATMVDLGVYKNDAHRMLGDRNGVLVWWSPVEGFLRQVGMPTRVQYRIAQPDPPKASGYAAIESVDAVPFLDRAGREGYRTFLEQYPGRAFAISTTGAWSWAEGGDDPKSVALANCQKQSFDQCRLYAVDQAVVWRE